METHVLPVSVKGVAEQAGRCSCCGTGGTREFSGVGAGNRCTSVVSSITIIAGPRTGSSNGDVLRLSWWKRAWRLIGCTIGPPINRQASINHAKSDKRDKLCRC